MKYLFKQIDNISGSNAVTTVEFEVDSLPDILEHFELFLKGAGYMMEGKIDIIPDEEYYGESGDEDAIIIQYHEATIKKLEKRIEELTAQPLWSANDGYADLAKVWINSASAEPMSVQENSIHYFDTMRNK